MERLLCNVLLKSYDDPDSVDVLNKEPLPMREAVALEREMDAYGSYNTDDFYIEIVDVPGTRE